MKNVELLTTKITYKGKEYNNFYLRLPNNRVISINFPMLFAEKVEKSFKAQIISELLLIAEPYNKE